MMPHPFLENLARPLLIVHALSALAAAGSAAHLLVLGVLLVVRGRAPARLIRMHARVLAALYASTLSLGMIIYPAFRVLVRGYVLDREAPWASNLFDFKEAMLLVGLPVVSALFVVGRGFELPRDDAQKSTVAALAVFAGVVVVVAVVAGLVVTSVRGPA